MIRINKQEALAVAEKITEPLRLKRKDLAARLGELCRKTLQDEVPVSLLSLTTYDELTKYVNTVDRAEYVMMGPNVSRYIQVYFEKTPCKISRGYNPAVLVPGKYAEEFNRLYDEHYAVEAKIKRLRDELAELLYGLGTYKRITENLPEAVPYLPSVEPGTLPAINLTQFRERLKKELS